MDGKDGGARGPARKPWFQFRMSMALTAAMAIVFLPGCLFHDYKNYGDKKYFGEIFESRTRTKLVDEKMEINASWNVQDAENGIIQINARKYATKRTESIRGRKYTRDWGRPVNIEHTIAIYLAGLGLLGIPFLILIILFIQDIAEGLTGTDDGIDEEKINDAEKWISKPDLDKPVSNPADSADLIIKGLGREDRVRTDNYGNAVKNCTIGGNSLFLEAITGPSKVLSICRRVAYARSITISSESPPGEASVTINEVDINSAADAIVKGFSGCKWNVTVLGQDGRPVQGAQAVISGHRSGSAGDAFRTISPPALRAAVLSRFKDTESTGGDSVLVTDRLGRADTTLVCSGSKENVTLDVRHLDFVHQRPMMISHSGGDESRQVKIFALGARPGK